MRTVLLLSLLLTFNSQASPYKELGESCGTKEGALKLLGEPTHKQEFNAPNFTVKGNGPVACKAANEHQSIVVWAYKETNGFYQLIFNSTKLVCLRWSSEIGSLDPSPTVNRTYRPGT